MWPGPYGNWGSRKYLIASLDQSLKRLGLDYVDIFYHHRMDPEYAVWRRPWRPWRRLCGAVRPLYVGLSNYNGEKLAQAEAVLKELHCPFIINQNRYSIFDRTVEQNGLKETAAKLHKGIIAFSPTGSGHADGPVSPWNSRGQPDPHGWPLPEGNRADTRSGWDRSGS